MGTCAGSLPTFTLEPLHLFLVENLDSEALWEPGLCNLGTLPESFFWGEPILGKCVGICIQGNLENLERQTLSETVPCNIGRLGNLARTFLWKPLLGELYLGTFRSIIPRCSPFFPSSSSLRCDQVKSNPTVGVMGFGAAPAGVGDFVGAFIWKPTCPHRNLHFTWIYLYLGTFAWEALLGNFCLITLTCKPLPGNLRGMGFGAAPAGL